MPPSKSSDDEVLFDRRLRNGKPVAKPRSIKRFAKTKIGKGDGADLPTVDMRSMLGRRFREVAIALIGDAGGLDRISAAKLSLIRRFAGATALAEQIEARAVEGQQVDITEYSLLTSSLVRIARIIGTSRIPREIVPSLDQYLAAIKSQEQEQAENAEVVEIEQNAVEASE